MILFVPEEGLDPRESKIIRKSLEYAIETTKTADNLQAFLTIGLGLNVFQSYTREKFLALLESTLALHNAKDALYAVTDYHFALIHQVLRWAIDNHNSCVLQGVEPIVMDSSFTVDFDELVERLFHDTFFLMDAAKYDSFHQDEKKALGFSNELFSICHGFEPHDSELEVVERPMPKKKMRTI
jgi:hypothetical protein